MMSHKTKGMTVSRGSVTVELLWPRTILPLVEGNLKIKVNMEKKDIKEIIISHKGIRMVKDRQD